jgi:hypothetical protein
MFGFIFEIVGEIVAEARFEGSSRALLGVVLGLADMGGWVRVST